MFFLKHATESSFLISAIYFSLLKPSDRFTFESHARNERRATRRAKRFGREAPKRVCSQGGSQNFSKKRGGRGESEGKHQIVIAIVTVTVQKL